MRRLALAIVLVLFAPGAAAAQHPILALLDDYAAGRHDEVRDALMRLEDVADARDALEDAGKAWVDAGDDGTIEQRRLIAATFALEFANARMLDEWQRLRSLVEWGCELLREGEATAAERYWHLASVALAQGARDWALLFPRGPSSTGQPARTTSYAHLRHATRRFPDDVQLRFTDALVASLRYGSGWPRRGGSDGHRLPVDSVRSRFGAIELLKGFTSDPLVGPEAELRTGVALLLLPEPERAIAHFDAARHGTDPFVTYLAEFFLGRLQEARGVTNAAAVSYQRALNAVPGAQSASLALSALLFADGRPDAAYDLAARALDAPGGVPDPWRLYGYGQYRDFDRYMRRLRQDASAR